MVQFNLSFGKNLDLLSEARASKYNRDVLGIMARLPPANMGDLVPLKHWQMSKMGITILLLRRGAQRLCR